VQSAIRLLINCFTTLQIVVMDVLQFALGGFRTHAALTAENLFLRKQLALYQERNQRHRRTSAADRFVLLQLSRLFDWRLALVIVKPATLVAWHRTAFRRFWRWKSRPPGRPSLPVGLKLLIGSMASDNPTWGEERIADELSLKLGIRVSPRTVARYVKHRPVPSGSRDQRWATFVRNHAKAIVACDFFVAITAKFRILYIFVAMEISSRRLLHIGVTEHPTAEWTIQQFREFMNEAPHCRFVIHDRHATFSLKVDSELGSFGVQVLRTPVHSPTANSFCERLIGSIRRECLDYLIPFNERHLRKILREWAAHYNFGRPHKALGPGMPGSPESKPPTWECRHSIPKDFRIVVQPVLGGLHHEYSLERQAA
jgi:putative transposase